ncbi:MAG: cell division protein ZapA [Alphaproteobacteria bacterium]|nr:cell division protein ZapA [Alphaproteobacteria bacterium]
MSKVTISLNGRAFTIGCEEGQQAYLRELASHLDGHVRELSERVGQIGDVRLLLMAALIVGDELREAQGRVEALEDSLTEARGRLSQAEARRRKDRAQAAEALNAAAARLEALASPEPDDEEGS